MARKTVEVETTGQAYLELLRERGVEYFFANAGTDFAPLIDAFARFAEQGKQTPKPITVPHENAAVAMAHGYYMVTGKPQMVMVHVNVGTGNAINGIINAARDNVPILFTAGRTPLTEAGLPGAISISTGRKNRLIRRACCASMSNGTTSCATTQLEAVVDRALEIAMTEPRGPIYMTLRVKCWQSRRRSLRCLRQPAVTWEGVSIPIHNRSRRRRPCWPEPITH